MDRMEERRAPTRGPGEVVSHPDRCVQCGQHKDDRPECQAVQAALGEMIEHNERLGMILEGRAPDPMLVELVNAVSELLSGRFAGEFDQRDMDHLRDVMDETWTVVEL